MGISRNRFTDRIHEQFVCAICLDVSVDPVVTNDCDHIFCTECTQDAKTSKCPSCRKELKRVEATKVERNEWINQTSKS